MTKQENPEYKESIEHTQEQAIAAWVTVLNQIRINELIAKLRQQDVNLEEALAALAELKEFIGDPEHILGSSTTKHGEIAEHVQVNISNARKLIEGLENEYTFEGVGRTAPEDYLHLGMKVQSKFYNGTRNTLQAISEHLEKYPDFVKNNGYYEIPKNQYEEIMNLLERSKTDPSSLSKAERRILESINKFIKETGLDISKDVKPSIVGYKDVQQSVVNETIDKEDKSIRKKDKEKREKAYLESKPSMKEAGKVTAVSAVTEGGLAFCLAVSKKLKEKKSFSGFTQEDWKDIGIDTSVGATKGAIRGVSIYGLTNFAHTPANIASAYVTASFGISSQINAYKNKRISQEEMIINCEILCLDVTVSALSSLIGQTIIPLPVLGAVIGNITGEFVYNICKKVSNDAEVELIAEHNRNINILDNKLQEETEKILDNIRNSAKKFINIEAMVFDEELNSNFCKSIERANFIGVPQEKILKTLDDINYVMMK